MTKQSLNKSLQAAKNSKKDEFYQIGLSENKTRISVNILGIEDKKYLTETYSKDFNKSSVTGHCIRFKTLKDINTDVPKAAIAFGFDESK